MLTLIKKRFPSTRKIKKEMDEMMKIDVISLIENKIEEENEYYRKHMENNPADHQRAHDHSVILSVYEGLLHDLKSL